MQGDGTTLLELADLYYERDDTTAYTQTLAANAAIYCLDHPEQRHVEQAASELAGDPAVASTRRKARPWAGE